MKRKLKIMSFLLIAVFMLSVVVSPNLGNLGVDEVAAATSAATSSASDSTPAPEEPVKEKDSTTSSKFLVMGSTGSAVKELQTKLNEFGYNLKVDGIFGKATLAAVKDFQSKNGLLVDGVVGPKTFEKLNSLVQEEPVVTVPEEPVATEPDAENLLKLGKVDYAAHGDKCFTIAVAAVAGDKIIDAYIDEYQFQSKETAQGVPNSDGAFGQNYKDPNLVLGSKRVNAEIYSQNMANKAGATVPINESYDAIQEYAKGKTIAELEAELTGTTPEAMVDAVSGATLADTHGYLSAILAAAKAAKGNSGVEVDEEILNNLELRKVDYAAHGDKCFTVAVAAVAGDKIIDAYIDEYQFQSKETAQGVPNSDGAFGQNYKDPNLVLGSKRVNAEVYSQNMANKAGATVPINESYDAIQKYVRGKTIAELEAELTGTIPEAMVDAVSGATLADTYGYLSAILAAAKSGIEEVDAVSTPSYPRNKAELMEAMGENGSWIIIFEEDMTVDEELVLEGVFYNKNDTSNDIYRKIAIYAQDEDHNVTERYTLTAPKLTIKSPNTRLQGGTFVGDIYVEAEGFTIRDAKVEGNVYFANEDYKASFDMSNAGEVTGKIEVLE